MKGIRAAIMGANIDISMRSRAGEKKYDQAALAEIARSVKAAGFDVVTMFYPGKSFAEALMYLLAPAK